jgi:bifunctional non-homologous end joining protein LigD
MSLHEYRQKRNFRETPEPRGGVRRSSSGSVRMFLVQKHDASRLHYDFRLEINGVLASWAIPKGPSLSPADKRLAVRTEDHPIEYGDFEGVIPEGQYGAGTVMVWDRGTYETSDGRSPEQQLANGEIKVVLHGQKLQGGFVLIRTGKGSADPAQEKSWLLIKQRDQSADRYWNIEHPKFYYSVLTGRTLKEIAEGRPSKKPAARASQTKQASPAKTSRRKHA